MLRWVSGGPGQGWSTTRSQVGRQSHLGQGRGSLLSRSTSRSGISEPGQEGLTGVPGPEAFTPEAPDLGQDSLLKLGILREKGLVDLEGQKEQFRMGREGCFSSLCNLEF